MKYVCQYCNLSPMFTQYHENYLDCQYQMKVLAALLHKITNNCSAFVSAWEFEVHNLAIDGEQLYNELCQHLGKEVENRE